jgi:hypothetical protein
MKRIAGEAVMKIMDGGSILIENTHTENEMKYRGKTGIAVREK